MTKWRIILRRGNGLPDEDITNSMVNIQVGYGVLSSETIAFLNDQTAINRQRMQLSQIPLAGARVRTPSDANSRD